ncbi:MAG: preprotein translocase subunit YajC [Polyangiales bacterium]
MLAILFDILVVLQSAVFGDGSGGGAAGGGAAGGGGATGAGGAAASGPVGAEGCAAQALPFAVIMVVFYFLLIRPQQKKQKEMDAMLKALKKGDVVRTTGGIRGEIFDVDDRAATLIVADKVKINVLRSHIAGPDVGPDDAAKESASSSKDDAKSGKGS